MGDGLVLLNSAEVTEKFQIEMGSINMGQACTELVLSEGILSIEVHVSLHMALRELCPMKVVAVDLPILATGAGDRGSRFGGGSYRYSGSPLEDIFVPIRRRLCFDIEVSNIPRAARVLIKVFGLKKKASSSSNSSSSSSSGSYSNGSADANSFSAESLANQVVLSGGICMGWAACTVFDFKGCVDCMQNLHLFGPEHDMVQVPINTTLNNSLDAKAAMLQIVFAPDLVLVGDSMTPRVRIVHSMPIRNEPIVGEGSSNSNGNSPGLRSHGALSEAHVKELNRILQISFNPLSSAILTAMDKAVLWDLRYSILDRADLLPAFVMSINWRDSNQVQELYDLLDLWATPETPVQVTTIIRPPVATDSLLFLASQTVL